MGLVRIVIVHLKKGLGIIAWNNIRIWMYLCGGPKLKENLDNGANNYSVELFSTDCPHTIIFL